ncbi:MAG TPA: hypothetical protein VH413_01830 [Verrucomicrobiae bacterium]|jgi:hypothetical protein|nr:hypothetical protein [Verrucomicrobiae bacterium]
MKTLIVSCFVICSATCGFKAAAQDFINLGFDQGTIVPDTSSVYYPIAVSSSDAIPGWTTTDFMTTDIFYNQLSTGSTSIAILDKNNVYGLQPLAGIYSIDLYGGVEGTGRRRSHQPDGDASRGCEDHPF